MTRIDGRLFGSITNVDIASALNAQGFEVAKAQVRMPDGPFKAVGEYSVTLSPHTDVTTDIDVVVVGAQ